MADEYLQTGYPFHEYPLANMRDAVLAGPGYSPLENAASVYAAMADGLDEAVLGVRAALEILREGREGEAAFAAQQHIISVVSTGEAGSAQARLAVQALNEQASYFARVHLDMNHLGTPSDGAGGFPVASDEVREAAVEASRRYEGNANFNYANMFQPFVPPPESGLDLSPAPPPPAVDWGGSGGTAGIGAAAAGGGFAPVGSADAPGALGGTASAAGAGGTNPAGAAGAGGGGAGQIVPGAVPRPPGSGGIGPATAGPPGAGGAGPGRDGTGVPGGGAPGSGAGGAAAPKGPAPGWVPAPRPGQQPVPGARGGYGTGTGPGQGRAGGGWRPGWTPTGAGPTGSGMGRTGAEFGRAGGSAGEYGRAGGSAGEFGRAGGSSAESRPGLGRGPVPGEPMSPGRTGGSHGGMHGGMPFLGGGAGGGGQSGEHRRPAWLVEDDPDSIWLSGLPPHGPAVIGEEDP